MPDQIIFTSSVRGIKPGTSGYCTVLRSPGIRTALEQALERISVFEHTKCNRGRVIYAYRLVEIREQTYHVLSRISDAGNDYTGRTNFLAHHLAFQKDEIPDLSPADLLLHWPGWCPQWDGEPREEPVDVQSLQGTSAVKPPATTWDAQAIGADGAIQLASDTQNGFMLRSKDCPDTTLLQLIAEALAVRAKFNKSYRYTWTTTFSVGLATVGSAKSFKWLALREGDDYALYKTGVTLDLDARLPGGVSADQELTAIAREGEYRPPQKPIPLSTESSVVDRFSTAEKGDASPQRAQRGRSSGKNDRQPIKLGLDSLAKSQTGSSVKKKPKKKIGLYVAISLIVLFAFGIGTPLGISLYNKGQETKKEEAKERYNQYIEELIKCYEGRRNGNSQDPVYIRGLLEYIDSGSSISPGYISLREELISTAKKNKADKAVRELWKFLQSREEYNTYVDKLRSISDGEARVLLENIRMASNPKVSIEELDGIDWSLADRSAGKPYDSAFKQEADKAFSSLLDRFQKPEDFNRNNQSGGRVSAPGKEDKVAPGINDPEAAEGENKLQASNTNKSESDADVALFNLGKYERIIIKRSGENFDRNEISISTDYHTSAVRIDRAAPNLSGDMFSSSPAIATNSELADICEFPLNPIHVISLNGDSYAIQHQNTLKKDDFKLYVILRDSFNSPLILGRLDFKQKYPATVARAKVDKLFEFNDITMKLLSKDGYELDSSLDPNDGESSDENLSDPVENFPRDETVFNLVEYIIKDMESSGFQIDLEELMKDFDEWAAAQIIRQIEEKKNAIEKGSSQDERKQVILNTEFDALNKIYDDIVEKTNKAKNGERIKSYFKVIKSIIDELKDDKKLEETLSNTPERFGLDAPPEKETKREKDLRIKAMKRGMDNLRATLALFGEKKEFKPNDAATYTLHRVSVQSDETWELSYDYSGDDKGRESFNLNGRFFGKQLLSENFENYVKITKRESEKKQKEAEAEKERKKLSMERNWQRIEFKSKKNGKVLAIVKIN